MAPACSSHQHFVLPAVAPACFSQQIKNECEAIYNFCKGNGWNEGKLVHILGRKNSAERKEMRDLFFAMYKEDLSNVLHAQVNGRLEKAIMLWMYDPAQRDAIIARTALQSMCPDFRALTEMLCSRTEVEILQIRQAYYSLYKTCLEEEIAQETVGARQKLLFTLAKAHRYMSKGVNNYTAKCDAKRLYDSGEGRIGINEGAIIKILSERNLDHLRVTFGYYKQLYGHDILKGLKKKTCGDFGPALRVIIKCIYFPAKYFAKVLHISLEGLGTRDEELTRIMVTRAE
ncbi:hypothetical protein KI387_022340, partial [Taxus chinensis]